MHAIRAMQQMAIPICLLLPFTTATIARDDGRYANSPLKPWFESLQSEFGKCCEDSDAYVVSEPNWKSDHGQYRVRIDDEWVLVPDGALIKQPNLAGRTLVWKHYVDGHPRVRCFIPGSMS